VKPLSTGVAIAAAIALFTGVPQGDGAVLGAADPALLSIGIVGLILALTTFRSLIQPRQSTPIFRQTPASRIQLTKRSLSTAVMRAIPPPISACLTNSTSAAKRERLSGRGPLRGFVGTVSEAVDLIGQYQNAGVQLLINSDYRNDTETHELMAAEVMPHFA
jgi:hypothetical protein